MKCEKKMTFDQCELAVLRHAVDNIEKKVGKKLIKNPKIQQIISIVENFLRLKRRVCYGGTAINNILPESDQFYDKSVELPDYDFFSPSPMEDAIHLADIYKKEGFDEVEAKAGAHSGTFKVFVNFMPVADITFTEKALYKRVSKDAMIIDGISYTAPDYLRMLMYLELSRPQGDASRWEKVLKRLTLLNKNFPLKAKNCDIKDIQRLFNNDSRDKYAAGSTLSSAEIFDTVREIIIRNGCIFFGAYANRLHLKKMPKLKREKIKKIPDFDVLSDKPAEIAERIKSTLKAAGVKKIKISQKPGIGEIIAPHYEVSVDGNTIIFLYEPMACHSYNIVHYKGQKIRIATLDTMLSFYLAFYYVNRPYYDPKRILCMCDYLYKTQEKNRLQQKGLLRRFSIDCYGEEQHTKEKSRAKKSEMYEKLKNKRGTDEWNWWFLRYVPGEDQKKSNKRTNKGANKNTHKKANNAHKKANNAHKKARKTHKRKKNKQKRKTKKRSSRLRFFT